MMPVLFAAAARERHPCGRRLAHVAGLAYFGMLFGPVVIGAVAQASNLTIGLSVVALCAALVARRAEGARAAEDLTGRGTTRQARMRCRFHRF